MKNEDAITGLKALSKEFSGYKPNEEMFDMAIEALEKQTPMKPILADDEDLVCPVCGADVEWKWYCEECGQRIDHGEKE